jgi:hypothetical protein
MYVRTVGVQEHILKMVVFNGRVVYVNGTGGIEDVPII